MQPLELAIRVPFFTMLAYHRLLTSYLAKPTGDKLLQARIL